MPCPLDITYLGMDISETHKSHNEGTKILLNCVCVREIWASLVASAYNAGDPALIPGLGRSPGEGNGNPLQCSCLENPMD